MTQRTPLQALAEELTDRGWRAQTIGEQIMVTNPKSPSLHEAVILKGDADFAWPWGLVIGPADQVSEAADRIQWVLRIQSSAEPR